MKDSPADLDGLLYDDDEVIDLERPAPEPREMSRAGWHARKADVLRREVRRLVERFDEEISALTDRRDRLVDTFDRKIEWHEGAVEAWHRAAFADGEVGKSVEFTNGMVSQLRAAQASTEILDEEVLRVWLAENGFEDDVYPVKPPKLSRQALKKVIAIASRDKAEPGTLLTAVHPETGEPVPGLRFRAMADRFNLKGRG